MVYITSSVTSSVMYVIFSNLTATTEIYTLSLHDALPISAGMSALTAPEIAYCALVLVLSFAIRGGIGFGAAALPLIALDRKSTRLNSSHPSISYAVFCLKKKRPQRNGERRRTTQPTLSKG